ncbi:putative uracil-DNA glycosylase [Trypanosoma vivax]|nr:putative uracil-DNA glycosylase [Trypanosoma vivax]
MKQRTLFDMLRPKTDCADSGASSVHTTPFHQCDSGDATQEDCGPAGEMIPPTTRPRLESNIDLFSLILDPGWRSFLEPLARTNFKGIEQFINHEIAKGKRVLPPKEFIFSAFNSTPLDGLKVVLLGQDPYHNIGQAHGLCFSVLPGVPLPPSLKNMYKELATDIPGFVEPRHGYLQHWAEQGILMLNATLTVEAHKANSHSACGWQAFTDGVIRLLSKEHTKSLVFLLWGGFARKKISLIDQKRHTVIECAHPSPLSAAKWWGSRPFSKCNVALSRMGHTPIDWNLPETATTKA